MAARRGCIVFAKRLALAGAQAQVNGATVAAGSGIGKFFAPILRSTACWREFHGNSLLQYSLKDVLKNEIEHEQQNYENPEVIANGPPAPFTLETNPGNTLLTLKRKIGDEEIMVDCSVNMQV